MRDCRKHSMSVPRNWFCDEFKLHEMHRTLHYTRAIRAFLYPVICELLCDAELNLSSATAHRRTLRTNTPANGRMTLNACFGNDHVVLCAQIWWSDAVRMCATHFGSSHTNCVARLIHMQSISANYVETCVRCVPTMSLEFCLRVRAFVISLLFRLECFVTSAYIFTYNYHRIIWPNLPWT